MLVWDYFWEEIEIRIFFHFKWNEEGTFVKIKKSSNIMSYL
jgi:hypothetical protein